MSLAEISGNWGDFLKRTLSTEAICNSCKTFKRLRYPSTFKLSTELPKSETFKSCKSIVKFLDPSTTERSIMTCGAVNFGSETIISSITKVLENNWSSRGALKFHLLMSPLIKLAEKVELPFLVINFSASISTFDTSADSGFKVPANCKASVFAREFRFKVSIFANKEMFCKSIF